jgi:hypothetical protein
MVARSRRVVAWAALVVGVVAAATMLLFAAYHVWAGGGPPTTPARRQEHMMWEFVWLAAALASLIAGCIAFTRLRREQGAAPRRACEARDG